jgi:hypothetical protein
METKVLAIIAIGFLGPLLVYLTRYVFKGKGKTPVASRLWFVSFCTYVVFYWLAKDRYIDTDIETFYFALLWPIAGILTYWATEKLGESPILYFRYFVAFMAGLIFAFALDTIGALAGWYSYDPSVVASAAITNPLTGSQAPAAVLIMLGVLMVGVQYLVTAGFDYLKKKHGAVTSTYVLIGLSFILGGLVWVATDFVIGLFR